MPQSTRQHNTEVGSVGSVGSEGLADRLKIERRQAVSNNTYRRLRLLGWRIGANPTPTRPPLQWPTGAFPAQHEGTATGPLNFPQPIAVPV